MSEKSIMIDLEDPRSSKIAEVLSNKTSKKILELISEKELSVGEIAIKLGLPVNTVMYNIDKLVKAELIEKAGWLWSMKGKRVERYKISYKRIVISPRKIIKGVIPALVVSLIGAGIIKGFFSKTPEVLSTSEKLLESSDSLVAGNLANGIVAKSASAPFVGETWAWFLLGAGVMKFLLTLMLKQEI